MNVELMMVFLHKGSYDSGGGGGLAVLFLLAVVILVLWFVVPYLLAIPLAILMIIKDAVVKFFKSDPIGETATTISEVPKTAWMTILGVVVMFAAMVIAVECANPRPRPHRLDRFDKAILSSVESEVKQVDCFEGYRMGMTRTEFYQHTRELMAARLACYDSISGFLYLGFDNPGNNFCKLIIVPSFYGGDGLYHIKFALKKGNDAAFQNQVLQRMEQEGWRKIKVPEEYYHDSEVRYPIFNQGFLHPDNLYEQKDQVFVKDNMMIVVRFLSVEYYNMPVYQKCQRRNQENSYEKKRYEPEFQGDLDCRDESDSLAIKCKTFLRKAGTGGY